METVIFEGTWEDLLRHASEFAGRRLRVSVLEGEPEADGPSLAQVLAGRIGQFHLGEAHLSEETGDKFARGLLEKRRQGTL